MRLNRDSATLAVGDRVVTDYENGAEDVVRRIVAVESSTSYGSGRWAVADEGEPCECCGRPFARRTPPIDASWFIPATPPAASGGKGE